MDLPKRTESRPPRPPVPKFRLIGAGTDTPDFLPPPKSEESFLIALSQDNMSETSSEDSQDSYFARKRLQAIIEEMSHQICVLGLSQDLLKTAITLLKPELLEGLKQKKYNAIAIAVLIASLKLTCQPITQKEILAKTQVSEKQIKKILLKIHSSYDLQSVANSFMKSIIAQLGLNEKFYEICCQILQEALKKEQLVQGEHENVIAAAIVKFVGDLIFQNRGGIIPQVIANLAKCNPGTMRIFQKKLEENQNLLQLLLKLIQKY